MGDIRIGIRPVDDARRIRRTLVETAAGHGAQMRGSSGLVADQIAEGIEHQGVIDPFDRLDGIAGIADDHAGAGIREFMPLLAQHSKAQTLTGQL